jgi:hypothetical protein
LLRSSKQSEGVGKIIKVVANVAAVLLSTANWEVYLYVGAIPVVIDIH